MRSTLGGHRSPHSRRLTFAFWLLSGAIAFLMTAARSEAQDGPMPPALLRRVAEAVQGLPTGYAVYVAVEMALPYEVIMIGPERAAVEESARRTHQRYAIVGPVEGEEPPHTMSYQLPCTHRADSYMQCPDSTHSLSVMPTSVLVIFRTGDQSDTVATFAPAEGDALFFNLSSMDKFVFPYYAKVFGIDYAARMRADYLRRAAAR